MLATSLKSSVKSAAVQAAVSDPAWLAIVRCGSHQEAGCTAHHLVVCMLRASQLCQNRLNKLQLPGHHHDVACPGSRRSRTYSKKLWHAPAVLFVINNVLFATWNCLDSQILGQSSSCKPGMGQKCSLSLFVEGVISWFPARNTSLICSATVARHV